MKRKRKNYTAEEKVAILKRHLVDKVAVSELCDEYLLRVFPVSLSISMK